MSGLLWTIALNGPLALAGVWAARHGLRQPRGWPRALASAVLAWAWMTLGVQALGSTGFLARGPLLGWSVLGLMLAGLLRVTRPAPADPEARPEGEWESSATLALALAIWAALTYGVPSLLLPVKVVSDAPIYHLYFAVRWWKSGRLELVPTPFGETATTYFPAGGDAWFAWLTVGWGGDRLSRVGQSPFLLLSALASYALARRLGVGRASATIAAGWFVTCLPLLLFSFEGNVDSIFIAGYLISAYFLLRYALRDDDANALALAGLAAGLAWGTKPTAIVFLPPLLALGAAAILTRPGGWGRKLRHLLLLGGTTLLPTAFWFARDAWLTGNPLYPMHLEAFGHVLLRGWFRTEAMRNSQFYIPREHWEGLVDIMVSVLEVRLLPIWLLAMGGAWAIGRGGRSLAGWVWLCSALAVLNVALYWLVIPYRTQQRFMLQALGLGVVPLGRLLDRGRWVRWLGAGLLLAHVLTPPGWPLVPSGQPIPWRMSRLIPPNTASLVHVPLTGREVMAILSRSERLAALGLLLGEGLVALAIAWAWGRSARRPARRNRWLAWGTTVALVGGVLAVYAGLTEASKVKFPMFVPFLPAWLQLDRLAGPSGTRVAYAGTNIPYYLMGPDFRSEVRSLRVDAHRDWLLHDYHLDAIARGEQPLWDTPRPGWDRLHPDYDAWLANLRAERIAFLVVARPDPIDGPFNVADAEGFPIERAWAEAHPETFQLVVGPREGSDAMRIYRVIDPEKSATDRRAGPH